MRGWSSADLSAVLGDASDGRNLSDGHPPVRPFASNGDFSASYKRMTRCDVKGCGTSREIPT